jgi:hypothetical protein
MSVNMQIRTADLNVYIGSVAFLLLQFGSHAENTASLETQHADINTIIIVI